MPHPLNRTKMTGDLHLPDVETGLAQQDGLDDETASERGRAGEANDEARPGRGINQAGLLKDKDAAKGSGSATRDPGERPR